MRLGVFLATALAISAGLAQAAEFSAQTVTRTPLGETRGAIYVKGEHIRSESSLGQKHIGIFRPDQQVVLILMPDVQVYMEVPLGKEDAPGFIKLPKDKGRLKQVGAETVNGYLTDRYESTVEMAGRTFRQTVWVARDLKFPIKMESADGSMAVEYRDIKEGPQPDGLFQVPEGYRKMEMPFPFGQSQPKGKGQK